MSNLLNHYKNILAGYKTAVDDVEDKLFGEKENIQENENQNKFGYFIAKKSDKNIVTNALGLAFGSNAKGFLYDEDSKIRLEPNFYDVAGFSPQQTYLLQTFKQIIEANISCTFSTVNDLQGGETKLPDGISYKDFIRNDDHKNYIVTTKIGANYNRGALYDTYGDQKRKYQIANNIKGDYIENVSLFQSILFWHELGHIVAWMKGLTWFNKTNTNKEISLFKLNNKFSVGYENIFRTHLNLPLRTGRTHTTYLSGKDVTIDDIDKLQKDYE
jgi:hypothetical protein